MPTNTSGVCRPACPPSSFAGEELSRLAAMQLPSGALPMKPVRTGASERICPYFSCFAALALLSGPPRYNENVRRYIEWHFAHLNTAAEDYNRLDGTIYDYAVTEADGGFAESPLCDENGCPTYDSTDSYAALFLAVLAEYGSVTGDRDLLVRYAAEIRRVAGAMLATQNGSLTRAKPDYPVKYTMDNCETAWGLDSAVRLCGWVPGLDGGILRGAYIRLTRAMEQSLWNRDRGYYEVGLDSRGLPVVPVFDWRQFYPDAMAQAFPILTQVLAPDSGRAQYLYRELLRYHPPQALDGGMQANASLLALTAARMEDADAARQYLAVHQKAFCQAGQFGTNCQGYALGVLAAAALQSRHDRTSRRSAV